MLKAGNVGVVSSLLQKGINTNSSLGLVTNLSKRHLAVSLDGIFEIQQYTQKAMLSKL